MKRICAALLALMMVLTGCAPKAEAATWQEQYELGLRYLEEGNYEEAILAFTAAIEIDPKQAEAYLGLADAYIGIEDYEKALEILQLGLEENYDHPAMLDKISEVKAKSVPLNSYGSTEFTKREKYSEFSSLEPAVQRRIIAIAEATITGDSELLLSLVDVDDGFDGSFFTVWNGYKIEVYDRSSWYKTNTADDEIDTNKSFSIEMRPENGMGYVCSVYDSYKENIEDRDHWLDYFKTVRVINCPCADWQWDGEFTDKEWCHYLYRSIADQTLYHVDYITNECFEETVTMGNMSSNLRDGLATATSHEINNWNIERINNDNADLTWTDTYVYKNGVLVEKNGELWDGGKGYQLIDGTGGGITYSDDLRMLDEMFW